MARVIAIANQKGGVAKTTTAAALAAGLVELGHRVLLVDLDAQACLTFAVGVDVGETDPTVADVLLVGADPAEVAVATAEGALLLPADLSLAAAEIALLDRPDRDLVLRAGLAKLAPGASGGHGVDVVVIDCSPSLGVLTLNALAAADAMVVPMTAEMLGHRAVGQILDTMADVQELLNPHLEIIGILPTMVDVRTAHARDVIADAAARFGVPLLDPVPRSVRVAEAAARGRSVLSTSPRSAAAGAYRALARRVSTGTLVRQQG